MGEGAIRRVESIADINTRGDASAASPGFQFKVLRIQRRLEVSLQRRAFPEKKWKIRNY